MVEETMGDVWKRSATARDGSGIRIESGHHEVVIGECGEMSETDHDVLVEDDGYS